MLTDDKHYGEKQSGKAGAVGDSLSEKSAYEHVSKGFWRRKEGSHAVGQWLRMF